MRNFEDKFTSLFKEFGDSLRKQPEEDLLFLQQLVEIIRPESEEDLNHPTQHFILFLESHPQERAVLAQCLKDLFASKSFVSLLTDVAIPQASDFFFEVKEKLVAKLIPSQPPKNHLAYYFNHLFHQAIDTKWIASLTDQQLIKIATLLELSTMRESTSVDGILPQFLYSLEILTLRLSGRAMESSVVRMVPEYNNLESPFVGFQDELSRFQHELISHPNLLIDVKNIDYKQLNVLLQQCKDYIKQAYKNAEKFGISLRVNQDLLRIKRQLERIEEVLPFLLAENLDEELLQTAKLFQKLILLNSVKDNLRNYLGEGTRLLAHEITQQTANTGEHYITSSKKQYFKMFLTALGGGMVV